MDKSELRRELLELEAQITKIRSTGWLDALEESWVRRHTRYGESADKGALKSEHLYAQEFLMIHLLKIIPALSLSVREVLLGTAVDP